LVLPLELGVLLLGRLEHVPGASPVLGLPMKERNAICAITFGAAAILVAGVSPAATSFLVPPPAEEHPQAIVESIESQLFRDHAKFRDHEDRNDEEPPSRWLDEYLARARQLDDLLAGTVAMMPVGLRREWRGDEASVLIDVAIQGPPSQLPRVARRLAPSLTLSPEDLIELRLEDRRSILVSFVLPYRYAPSLQVPSFEDNGGYVDAPNGDARLLVTAVVVMEPGVSTSETVELRLRNQLDRCTNSGDSEVVATWFQTRIEFATVARR
jgi:hypothetical protein